jgi:hypothetical protein
MPCDTCDASDGISRRHFNLDALREFSERCVTCVTFVTTHPDWVEISCAEDRMCTGLPPRYKPLDRRQHTRTEGHVPNAWCLRRVRARDDRTEGSGGERTPLPHLNAMLLPPTGQPRMVSRISSTDGALPCCQGLQWNRAADREGRRWCRSGGQSDDWITRPKMNPCRQFRFEANGL